jgi:hypothetical protein
MKLAEYHKPSFDAFFVEVVQNVARKFHNLMAMFVLLHANRAFFSSLKAIIFRPSEGHNWEFVDFANAEE